MVFLVDDILEIPAQFFQVIFNSVIQTAYKSAWLEYRRQLNIALIRARRQHEEGRLSKDQFREIEKQIFTELRLAKRVLGQVG